LGVVALVVAVGIAAAVALASRGGGPTPKPLQAKPGQQFSDDADLMRRLERQKLVTRPKDGLPK
jgi:hypothetical protein